MSRSADMSMRVSGEERKNASSTAPQEGDHSGQSMDDIELDDEQAEVAFAAPEDRVLVIAAAGRGKTEVVFHRIRTLVQDEGLSPMGEVVVLTFSRAAVDAVHSRLRRAVDLDATIRTFDSFATAVLLDAGFDLERTRGFDDRIRIASSILNDTSNDLPIVEDIRHLIIDEAQDLVGDRADLVSALLRRLGDDVGITVLGDPLQGIYDFQLEPGGSSTASIDLFEAIRNAHGARDVVLRRDYRARGADPKKVSRLGDELREIPLGHDARLKADGLIAGLVPMSPISDFLWAVSTGTGKTALLSETNADALKTSQLLISHGLAHSVRRPATEMGPRSWMARAFKGIASLDLTEDDAIDAIEGHAGAPDPDEAWMAIRSVAGASHRRSVSMARLRAVVRSGALPWSLLESSDSDLVVSTIHRAKGLEFDRVFILARQQGLEEIDLADSLRRDYVALSRARDDIFMSKVPQPSAGYQRRVSGRWVENFWWKRKPKPRALEFRPNDTASLTPFGRDEADARRAQTALNRVDIVGQEIVAWLDDRSAKTEVPIYELRLSDGTTLGKTTEGFGHDFAKTFWRKPGTSWPIRIDNLMLTAVESAAGEPADTRAVGLGPGGFWLVPRILGLATPDWKSESEL